MELRQLHSLVVLAENAFNVTEAAERLHIVQSAVSQHLSKLEQELGVRIFVRKGKRLVGLTAAGELVLSSARKMLTLRDNILDVGRDHLEETEGELRIGTTHTQGRYVLPAVIRAFHQIYPYVRIEIHQGTPEQLVEMAVNNEVDFSFCTEKIGQQSSLNAIPVYRWNRALIAPVGHPVLRKKRLSLENICEFPLVTYTFGFSGTSRLHTTISRAGLHPNIVLTAVDTDVIKTYVREGLGIGLIAAMAYSTDQDADLEQRDLSNLLPWETTSIAYHKDKYLRRFQLVFIDLLNDMVGDQGVVVKTNGSQINVGITNRPT